MMPIDYVTVALVPAGVLVGTVLQAGPRACTASLLAVVQMIRHRCRPIETKAALAVQLALVERHGFYAAKVVPICDAEFDKAFAGMVQSRSTQGLGAYRRQARLTRLAAHRKASRIVTQAAALAPAMGLAGTLWSLGQLSTLEGGQAGAMAAAGAAIFTTLAGIVLSQLILVPLAHWIDRSGSKDDDRREELYDWMETQLRRSGAQPLTRIAA